MGNWVPLIRAGRANITTSTEWKSILSEEQRTHQVYVLYTNSNSSWSSHPNNSPLGLLMSFLMKCVLNILCCLSVPVNGAQDYYTGRWKSAKSTAGWLGEQQIARLARCMTLYVFSWYWYCAKLRLSLAVSRDRCNCRWHGSNRFAH